MAIFKAHGYRQENATLVGVRDPLKIEAQTSGEIWVDWPKPGGVLALYNNGNHLYSDETYYRYIHSRGLNVDSCWHPGMTFVPRETFRRGETIGSRVWLRHDGFEGKPGNRIAKVCFCAFGQFSRRWEFAIRPHETLHFLPAYSYPIETVWKTSIEVNSSRLSLGRRLK